MKKARKQERGVALLLVLFALMIISALALSMLFSSDTETMISANYRDKQAAVYGALSGLQEGRARIHPKFGDLYPDSVFNTGGVKAPVLPPPNGAPTGYHVLYIVNKFDDGVEVAPWDPSNKYFDTELCQERVLGLSGTPGIPCSGSGAVPSVAGWYKVYNNNTGTTTNWTQDKPLYRWVRIMLKTNSMSPLRIPDDVKATSATYSGKQLCFYDNHQVLVDPATGMCGAPTNTPTGGGITAVTPDKVGSGYALGSHPTVTLLGGGGSGAAVTANVTESTSGSVTGVKLTAGGTGYSSLPTVTIDPPATGYTATATAVLSGWPVNGVTVTAGNPPTCFDSSTKPTVSFDKTYAASNATAHAVMTGTACVYSMSVKLTGTCNPAPGTYTVSASGGSGSGFSGQVVIGSNGKVASATVMNPGSYTSMPSDITGLCSKGASPSFSAGVHVNNVVVDSGGEYSQVPTVSLTGASYSGAAPQATASLNSVTAGTGAIKDLKLISGGSGYTAVPAVHITGGGGSGGAGVAYIDTIDSVTSYTVTNPGKGYTSAPIVTVGLPTSPAPPTGVQATAVATVGGGSTTTTPAGGQGAVYEITALAETPSGARAMAQMEVTVTYAQYNFALGGALTMAGSNPNFGTPHSMPFQIQGKDANSCAATSAFPTKPAIGVYDPTDPSGSSALRAVLTSLAKPQNYLGSTAAPSVQNTDLGNPTPQDLETFANTVRDTALSSPNGHVYPANPGSIEFGTADQPVIDVIDGDYSMGPRSGYGILLVRGTLTISGNYDWHGLILVIGKGASVMNGGGNGQITGAVFVANTNNGTGVVNTILQNEVADWSGGGGNGVQYDHCWADNLLAQIPSSFTPSANALKVLSQRMLEY